MLDFEKRFLSIGQQTIFCAGDLMFDAFVYGELIARALAALPRVGAVVLSDYAKGVLTPRVLSEIIAAANKSGTPVLVDPKAVDYTVYRGATVIKPNRRELAETARLPVTTDDEIIAAAAKLNEQCGTQAV